NVERKGNTVSSQTVDSFFVQVSGTLDAIVLACTALTATHPEKEKVLALLAGMAQSAAAADSDDENAKHYKLGMRTAVANIAKGVEAARLAEEIRDLKSETGSH